MTPVAVLGELIGRQAQQYAAKTALSFEGRKTTYAQLHRHSNLVAQGLMAAGIRAGDRVSYLGKNSDWYFELLFGATQLGAVMAPINWRLADSEIEWIAADAEIRALFVDAEFTTRIEQLRPRLTSLRLFVSFERTTASPAYEPWRDCATVRCQLAPPRPNDVAVQIYTSGTTGRPKGAMLTHRNLLAFRTLPPEQQPEWNRWTADDVSLIVMPVFHIGGTGFGLQTLCAGATGLVAREFDPGQVLDFIAQEGLSKLFAAPTILQRIVRHPRARDIDYRRIRTVVYGGSPMPLELLREAMEVFRCGFVQQYGMTETTGTICVLPPDDHDPAGSPRMRSAGRALNNVEIAILNAEGQQLLPREIGEVAIRSATNMAGYWKQPAATAACLRDGWLRSGDLGYLDADGYLYIHDRLKDMIVSGGENIYPAEVESVMGAHPAVGEVAVFGVPSERWGEEAKALIVPAAHAALDGTEILAWTRARIAAYKVPKSIEFVPSLPHNATGKVLKRELRERYWSGRERNVN